MKSDDDINSNLGRGIGGARVCCCGVLDVLLPSLIVAGGVGVRVGVGTGGSRSVVTTVCSGSAAL